MSRAHRVPLPAFALARSALCALLMFGLWTACTKAPKASPGARGVVKAVVTFDGTNVTVDPNPIPACFIGPCAPKANQIHWDIPTGQQLSVKINSSFEGKPCLTYPELPYRDNPGFATIRCSGSHCETVGPPRKMGCYKYDVTVTPSGGNPVTSDPDMIIM